MHSFACAIHVQKLQFISYGKNPQDYERLSDKALNQIYADITTAFTILIGIFFPSVTGKLNISIKFKTK